MSLRGVATETLRILDAGEYQSNTAAPVVFREQLQAAIRGTRLYEPQQGYELLARDVAGTTIGPSRFEVTGETTQIAAHRMAQEEGCSDVVLLNYASARNAGGGFISGAKAQEEDLCRCSGLYPCLITQPAYYEANRRETSLLYTDHVIYSPQVPFFKTDHRELLDHFFLASVITAPAPNAGEHQRKSDRPWPQIETALRRRAGIVLAIAREHGHRNLLLGAWGCGVFRNRPQMVAEVFGTWLAHPSFQGCFDRVVFGVYSRGAAKESFKAFQARFQVDGAAK